VPEGRIMIVGGTSGMGLALARRYLERGAEVVVTGRDGARAGEAAASLNGSGLVTVCCFDLCKPEEIAAAVADVGPVQRLVLAAIERDENSVREYDLVGALRLVTLKLVGYTEVVHALAPSFTDDASVLVFGGQALQRPYAGSTTVTTVNGGVTGLVRTLAVELAPVRVNAIHPGVVGDTPAWSGKPEAVLEAIRARTPIGRLVTTEDIVDAAVFLLENRGVNGVNLEVDGGWVLQ
jgi:NAD(P)-dependent dehydrogenase (short-subunit alcohol dehydrogenase family)